MFKVLILAARHTVSDERMEFLIRDRLSWLRFLEFDLGAPTPDRNTIWTFRERLIRAGAMDKLFAVFDRELRAPAIWRWADRSSMRPWCRLRSNATATTRRRRSRRARARPGSGPISRPSRPRRTSMHAGRSRPAGAGALPDRSGNCPPSRSRYSGTRTTSSSTGPTASFAAIDALTVQTREIELAVAALELAAIEIEGSDSLDNPEAVFE